MLSLVQVLYGFLLNRVFHLSQIVTSACTLTVELLCNSKVAKEQSNDCLRISLVEPNHCTSSSLHLIGPTMAFGESVSYRRPSVWRHILDCGKQRRICLAMVQVL